jgi:hypothetical protein
MIADDGEDLARPERSGVVCPGPRRLGRARRAAADGPGGLPHALRPRRPAGRRPPA